MTKKQVEEMAYYYSEFRSKNKIEGTPLDDWLWAETTIGLMELLNNQITTQRTFRVL